MSRTKKKIVNINELNAYKLAYGKSLGKSDYFAFVAIPTLIGGVVGLITFYSWFTVVIGLILGALYGLAFYLPKNIKKAYEEISFHERNRFIGNMTQILTNESKTVIQALTSVIPRAKGEFQNDLSVLQAQLIGADNLTTREAFHLIEDKYSEDVIFGQYIEQLETATIEGRTNIDTLKDIKTYHNQVKKKKEDYEKLKKGHFKDFKFLMVIIGIFILAITFSFGFETYINAFAHSLVGWVVLTLFVVLNGRWFKKVSTYLFDDSVTEVRLK